MANDGPLIDPRKAVLDYERDAIGRIMSTYRDPWDQARRFYVQQAQLSHAFLQGHQYVRHTGKSLKHVPVPPGMRNQVRMVINLLKPTVRVMLSMLTRNKPKMGIRALTSDFVDEARVQVGEKLLASLHTATDKREIDLRNWLWQLKGGTTIVRAIYNPEANGFDDEHIEDGDGNRLYYDTQADNTERSEPEVEEILTQMILDNPDIPEDVLFNNRFEPIMVPVFHGEIQLKVESVMEFLADPAAWSLRETDKVIHEQVMSLDTIKKIWPEKGKLVQPSDGHFTQFDSMMGALHLPGAGLPRITGKAAGQSGGPDKAVVHCMQCKPGMDNPWTGKPMPLGSEVFWSGNVVLNDLDDPLPYAETPETAKHDLDFDGVDYRFLPGEGFHGQPFLSDLLSLQQSVNRRTSQIAESINAWVHPKALVPMGSRIKKGNFSDLAGEIIEFAGVPPSYLEPPTIRPYVFKFLDFLIQQYNDVSLIHEVIRQGRVPPQVRTAEGLRQLQETDSLALGATIAMFEEAEGRLGQKMLDRARQFYEDGRILRYIGDKHKLEVEIMKRDDESDFFQHDWAVFVYKDSAMPRSKAASVADAFQIMQFVPQYFMDESTGALDKAEFARVAGLGDIEHVLEEQDESRQAAKHENLLMDRGENIQPRPYEEDAVHLKVHYAELRSPDFREKPEEIQQIFIQHAAAHEQQLGQKVRNMNEIGSQMAQHAQAAEAAARQAGVEAGVASARAVAEQEAQKLLGGGGNLTEPSGNGSSNQLIKQLLQSGRLPNA